MSTSNNVSDVIHLESSFCPECCFLDALINCIALFIGANICLENLCSCAMIPTIPCTLNNNECIIFMMLFIQMLAESNIISKYRFAVCQLNHAITNSANLSKLSKILFLNLPHVFTSSDLWEAFKPPASLITKLLLRYYRNVSCQLHNQEVLSPYHKSL